MPAAGRLLVPGRPINDTHLANVRGSLEAGVSRMMQEHAGTGARRPVFGMSLTHANRAKAALKAKLVGATTTDHVDMAVAEFLQELHGTLLELRVIIEGRHPEVEEYVDFYNLCLSHTKDYMNTRPSLRHLVTT